MKSINELIQNDPNVAEAFKKVVEPDYRELLIETKLKIYEQYLKTISDEELDYEISTRGVLLDSEIDFFDNSAKRKFLIDFASEVLFDNPETELIDYNRIYFWR